MKYLLLISLFIGLVLILVVSYKHALGEDIEGFVDNTEDTIDTGEKKLTEYFKGLIANN